jgi:hypothetical protein
VDELKPPPRPRRRPVSVYLTADERDCVTAAAAANKQPRAAWLRRVALYRAGWQGYSGPMFSSDADQQRLELHQIGDALHEALRTLRELATTVLALYARELRPGAPLLRMLQSYSRLISGSAELGALRHFDDVLELVFELETMAADLQLQHRIIGDQLEQAVRATLDALTQQESQDGKQQSRAE